MLCKTKQWKTWLDCLKRSVCVKFPFHCLFIVVTTYLIKGTINWLKWDRENSLVWLFKLIEALQQTSTCIIQRPSFIQRAFLSLLRNNWLSFGTILTCSSDQLRDIYPLMLFLSDRAQAICCWIKEGREKEKPRFAYKLCDSFWYFCVPSWIGPHNERTRISEFENQNLNLNED